jgi:hypothetical protein
MLPSHTLCVTASRELLCNGTNRMVEWQAGHVQAIECLRVRHDPEIPALDGHKRLGTKHRGEIDDFQMALRSALNEEKGDDARASIAKSTPRVCIGAGRVLDQIVADVLFARTLAQTEGVAVLRRRDFVDLANYQFTPSRSFFSRRPRYKRIELGVDRSTISFIEATHDVQDVLCVGAVN